MPVERRKKNSAEVVALPQNSREKKPKTGAAVKRAGTKSGRQRAYLADRCTALGSAPLSARLDHFHDSRRGETSGSQEERSRQEAGGAAAPLTLHSLRHSLYRPVPSSPSDAATPPPATLTPPQHSTTRCHKHSVSKPAASYLLPLAPSLSRSPPHHHHHSPSLSLLSLKSQGIITPQLHDSPPPAQILKDVV